MIYIPNWELKIQYEINFRYSLNKFILEVSNLKMRMPTWDWKMLVFHTLLKILVLNSIVLNYRLLYQFNLEQIGSESSKLEKVKVVSYQIRTVKKNFFSQLEPVHAENLITLYNFSDFKFFVHIIIRMNKKIFLLVLKTNFFVSIRNG